MNLLRKVSITSLYERTVTVRKSGSISTRKCPEYGCTGIMVSVSSAADLSKQSLRTICRRVEAGQIHYYECVEGLFVCLRSLATD
jgi:hypothetical protein